MARREAYAEHVHYRDTGCDVHPACLSCPLPECKYEYSVENVTEMRARRDDAIQRDRKKGMTVPAIARKHRVSERVVQRAFHKTVTLPDQPGKPWNPDKLPAGMKPRRALPSLKPY